MIEHYGDHAANERTYLAWVRTALAFMGFGLIVERFDLVLHSVRALDPAAPESVLHAPPREVGIALIALGVVVLGVSTRRYLHFKRMIASMEIEAFEASRSDLALVAIVVAIALAMAAYVLAQAL